MNKSVIIEILENELRCLRISYREFEFNLQNLEDENV